MKFLLIGIASIWILCWHLNGWGMSSRPPATLHLWNSLSWLSTPPDDSTTKEPWILQEQFVQFSDHTLSILRDPARSLPQPLVIELADLPGREMHITSRRIARTGSTIVQGTLDGSPPGEILLSVRGEAVAGIVRIGTRTWRIEYHGNGRHRVTEIDAGKFLPD